MVFSHEDSTMNQRGLPDDWIKLNIDYSENSVHMKQGPKDFTFNLKNGYESRPIQNMDILQVSIITCFTNYHANHYQQLSVLVQVLL